MLRGAALGGELHGILSSVQDVVREHAAVTQALRLALALETADFYSVCA